MDEEEFGFWKEMLDEKGWKDHHYLALSPNNSAFAGFIHDIPSWADIPKGSAAKMFPTYALISPKGIVIDRNFARPLNSSFDDSVKLAINEHL